MKLRLREWLQLWRIWRHCRILHQLQVDRGLAIDAPGRAWRADFVNDDRERRRAIVDELPLFKRLSISPIELLKEAF